MKKIQLKTDPRISILAASDSSVTIMQDSDIMNVSRCDIDAASMDKARDPADRAAYREILQIAEAACLRRQSSRAYNLVRDCSGHRSEIETVRPFVGAVDFRGRRAPRQDPEPLKHNPRAHGGVCEHQTCRCGAERRVNVNGQHVERGPWVYPEADFSGPALPCVHEEK